MIIEGQENLSGKSNRTDLLVISILKVTGLTALGGAITNWCYERFFAPELYVLGPPLMRVLGLVVLSFPFILIGLVALGIPTVYVLRRAHMESAISYAVAGIITGPLLGFLTVATLPRAYFAFAAYGCSCALLWWWLRPKG